jgi:hypothetical protein
VTNMDDMTYEAFVPTHSHLIGKKAEEIQKEFGIIIEKIDEFKEFRSHDRFRAKGHYMKIRKFRHKYDLW